MVDQHIESRRGRDGRGDPGAARPGGPVRRDRGRPGRAHDRAPSARSRRDAVGLPGRAGRGLRVDGQLRVHDADADRRASPRTPRTRSRATTSAATSSRCWSRAARRRSTTSRATRCPGAHDRERGYWRDVGTLDAYYDAHMDLISVDPVFNLYNHEWPILTGHDPLPPAKFVLRRATAGTGTALDSMVCAGRRSSRAAACAARCSRPGVRVHSCARGRGLGADGRRRRSAGSAIVRNAILDKNVADRRGRADRRRPRPRPRAVHRLGQRDRGDRQERGGRGVTAVGGTLREALEREARGGARRARRRSRTTRSRRAPSRRRGAAPRARAGGARGERRRRRRRRPAASTPARSTGSGSTSAGSSAIAAQLRELAALPPLERDARELDARRTGCASRERRIPVGVVGANFEARPNVAVDVAGAAAEEPQRGACCAPAAPRSAR